MPFDRARYYSSPAVLRQYHESGLDRKRSDFVLSDGTMPMSNGWAKYRRFHPTERWVFVAGPDGVGHWITEKQAMVLRLAEEIIDTDLRLTMREMAERLEMAPSTISRALCKFSAWGLIAYIAGRGRWAGLVIFRRFKDDGLERFRKAAKERVRRWAVAAEKRVSRLRINVASYVHGRGEDSLTTYLRDNSMDATLKRPWTPEELREAGII